MNRQQALGWLVENVTTWPVTITQLCDINNKKSIPESLLFEMDSVGNVVCYVANYLCITQQDWLDASDNMEKKEGE